MGNNVSHKRFLWRFFYLCLTYTYFNCNAVFSVQLSAVDDRNTRSAASDASTMIFGDHFNKDLYVKKTVYGNETTDGDNLQFWYLILKNGLQVTFFSTEFVLSNIMATTVYTGFNKDPATVPGLAHFSEHLLLLGSANYSDGNGLSTFIQSSGNFNAVTKNSFTIYFQTCLACDLLEWTARVCDMLRFPNFQKRFFLPEMNAIENEFAEYQHTYQWLLTLAEITMNSDTPSKKNSVGAAALHVALKEKGSDYIRAHLAVFNALHYTANNMEIKLLLSSSDLKHVPRIIEMFSRLPEVPPKSLQEVKEKIKWMGLPEKEVDIAYAEQMSELDIVERSLANPIFKLHQFGEVVFMGSTPSKKYILNYVFPFEVEHSKKLSVAFFLHLLEYVEPPPYMRNGMRWSSAEKTVFADYPTTALIFGLSVNFKTSPFENGNAYRGALMLFEYLGELFSLPESELKRLFWETVVARTPKVPPFDRLFFATQFFYRDPKKVVRDVLTPFEWDYNYLMDTVRRFLVPENMLLIALAPDYVKNARSHPDDWKTVEVWNFKYRTSKLHHMLLSRCRAAWTRGLNARTNGRKPMYQFIISSPLKTNRSVKSIPKRALNGDTLVSVPVAGMSRKVVDSLREEAKTYQFTLHDHTFRGIPDYFRVSYDTNTGGAASRVVEVIHEQTPKMPTSEGRIALKFHSPLVYATASWYMWASLFASALGRELDAKHKMICATLNEPWCLFFSRDTDAEHKCIADVVPGWRGEWFQLMIKGDSELVGSSYQEALGYISSLWSTNTTQVIRMVDNFHYRLQKMSLSDLPSNEKARQLLSALSFESSMSFRSLSATLSSIEFTLYELLIPNLRMIFEIGNPTLVVTGDFTREDAAEFALAFAKSIPFKNQEKRFIQPSRVPVMPSAPNVVKAFDVHEQVKMTGNIFAATFQVFNDDGGINILEHEVDVAILNMILSSQARFFYRQKLGMCYVVETFLSSQLQTGSPTDVTLLALSTTHTAFQMEKQLDMWKQFARDHIAAMPANELETLLQNTARYTVEADGLMRYDIIRFEGILLNRFDIAENVKKGFLCARMAQDVEAYRKKLLNLFDRYIMGSAREVRTIIEAAPVVKLGEEVEKWGENWRRYLGFDEKDDLVNKTQCFGAQNCRNLIGFYKLYPFVSDDSKQYTEQLYAAQALVRAQKA